MCMAMTAQPAAEPESDLDAAAFAAVHVRDGRASAAFLCGLLSGLWALRIAGT